MLQFILDGPEIPSEVLQASDNESLVFFCGAGISKPTGLPLFGELADHVWKAVQPVHDMTPAEQACIDRQQFDRFLGLLEQRIIPGLVRKQVIERILTPYSGALFYHKPLLELSTLRSGGVRLVTTNFDHRFIEAGCDRAAMDSAPKLPIPKSSSWKTLVYIHGLIDNDQDPEGRNLLLTAADFGRAYLTDGWASRFLTELFRKFTVVFIGYSIDDPIVSYLMSALAGERAQTEQYREAYAFVSFDGTKTDDAALQEALWKSKGVVPILFDCQDNYRLLVDTLDHWSRLYSGKRSYRSEIISTCIGTKPKGIHDLLSKQVCWALYEEDPISAKTLATSKETAALEWWLDIFDQLEISINEHFDVRGKLSELPNTVLLKNFRPSAARPRLVAKENCFAEQLHPVTYWLVRWLSTSKLRM